MRAIKPWVRRCPACGLLMSSLPAGAGTGVAGLEALRRANFETVLDRLSAHLHLPGSRILEVGCARGWFLEAARRRGAEARGLEPERANADAAAAAGLDVRVGYFPDDVEDAPVWDAIVFNDVFEHLPAPGAAIRAVERRLKPGGIAVLNIPSSAGAIYRAASLLDRLGIAGPFDRLWQRGLASPHMIYVSPDNLSRLVARHTSLRPVWTGRLRSVAREGLWPRIASTHPGMAGRLLLAAAWAGSFALDWLPSDIVLALFRKPPSEPQPAPLRAR